MKQEFKVGDLVRVVRKGESWNTEGKMDKYLGYEARVVYGGNSIRLEGAHCPVNYNDHGYWNFKPEDLALLRPASPQPTATEIRAHVKCPKPFTNGIAGQAFKQAFNELYGTYSGRATIHESNMVELERKITSEIQTLADSERTAEKAIRHAFMYGMGAVRLKALVDQEPPKPITCPGCGVGKGYHHEEGCPVMLKALREDTIPEPAKPVVNSKTLLGNHSQQTWQDRLVDLLIDSRYSEAAAIMAAHKEEIEDIAESVEDTLEAIRSGDY